MPRIRASVAHLRSVVDIEDSQVHGNAMVFAMNMLYGETYVERYFEQGGVSSIMTLHLCIIHAIKEEWSFDWPTESNNEEDTVDK